MRPASAGVGVGVTVGLGVNVGVGVAVGAGVVGVGVELGVTVGLGVAVSVGVAVGAGVVGVGVATTQASARRGMRRTAARRNSAFTGMAPSRQMALLFLPRLLAPVPNWTSR